MNEPKRPRRATHAWRRLRLRWIKFSQPVLGPFRGRWNNSLMVRTMTITGLVTGAMIAVAGVFLLTSVSNDLYSSRRDQALQDSARATVQAQRIIDSFDPADRGGLQSLLTSVLRTVARHLSEPDDRHPQAAEPGVIPRIVARRQHTVCAQPGGERGAVDGGARSRKEPQYWQVGSPSAVKTQRLRRASSSVPH